MQTVRAYFDGNIIRLEEQLELKTNDRLLVTLLKDETREASSSDIEIASLQDALDDDFLSNEELQYYKSLK